jgi:hypothetical protein
LRAYCTKLGYITQSREGSLGTLYKKIKHRKLKQRCKFSYRFLADIFRRERSGGEEELLTGRKANAAIHSRAFLLFQLLRHEPSAVLCQPPRNVIILCYEVALCLQTIASPSLQIVLYLLLSAVIPDYELRPKNNRPVLGRIWPAALKGQCHWDLGLFKWMYINRASFRDPPLLFLKSLWFDGIEILNLKDTMHLMQKTFSCSNRTTAYKCI